jgi:hypothetical protein
MDSSKEAAVFPLLLAAAKTDCCGCGHADGKQSAVVGTTPDVKAM